MITNYSKKHNIIFIHQQKTAGMSIMQALDIEKSGHYPVMVLEQLIPSQIIRKAKKMMVIRNPWDRMVSWWEYTKHHHPHHNLDFSDWLRGNRMRIASDGTFLMSQVHFHLSMKPEDVETWIPYYALNFDMLDRDWKKFCENTGVDIELPYKNQSVEKRHYTEVYSTWDDVNLVQNLFIEDIETFGWKFGKEKNAAVFSEGVA
jgi:hypothetical protein